MPAIACNKPPSTQRRDGLGHRLRLYLGQTHRPKYAMPSGRAVVAWGAFGLELDADKLQTLALVTLVFGNQALLFVVRERRRVWSSRPSTWILAASALDLVLVTTLAASGTLVSPLPMPVIATVLAAVVGLALVLDQVKLPVVFLFRIEPRVGHG